MFVLQKKILFARGLNWDQSRLWKTPPSHFLLFSPLACPYFLKKIHLLIFGELRKLHAKIYTFSMKIHREINFRSWLLFYCIFHSCRHFAIVQWSTTYNCITFLYINIFIAYQTRTIKNNKNTYQTRTMTRRKNDRFPKERLGLFPVA